MCFEYKVCAAKHTKKEEQHQGNPMTSLNQFYSKNYVSRHKTNLPVVCLFVFLSQHTSSEEACLRYVQHHTHTHADTHTQSHNVHTCFWYLTAATRLSRSTITSLPSGHER